LNNATVYNQYLCWADDYYQYFDECYNTTEGANQGFVVINTFVQ